MSYNETAFIGIAVFQKENTPMIVNVEFFDREALNNVITCIHFHVDKVIFFGYREVMEARRDSTAGFLREYCGVSKTSFHEVSHSDPKAVFQTMQKVIEQELEKGEDIFFDITGGESMILAVFGMMAMKYRLPVYQYDVSKDRLMEYVMPGAKKLSETAQELGKTPGIDEFIEIQGGKVNHSLQKSHKFSDDEEFEEDVRKIWQVVERHWESWNSFSDFLKGNMVPDEDLRVNKKTITLMGALSEAPSSFNSIGKLNRMVEELAEAGALLDVEYSNASYRFRFKNQKIKDCLWESGSMLELHVYLDEKEHSDDCRVGVHLDWDQVLHSQVGSDVMNEIDVLSLKGNMLTFISCKSGKLGSSQSLYALYELQTVAERFGGRYARKKLVIMHPMNRIYQERAAEMGIEVVCLHS